MEKGKIFHEGRKVGRVDVCFVNGLGVFGVVRFFMDIFVGMGADVANFSVSRGKIFRIFMSGF